MGIIKEPKNVDLTIQSTPWTKDELAMLSAVIKEAKKKKEAPKNIKPRSRTKKKHWA